MRDKELLLLFVIDRKRSLYSQEYMQFKPWSLGILSTGEVICMKEGSQRIKDGVVSTW